MGNNKAVQNKKVEKQKLPPKDDVFRKLSYQKEKKKHATQINSVN